MKILIISRGIPSKTEPQWGCFELDQAKALQKLGHEVAILTVDRRWKWNLNKIGIHYKHDKHITTIEGRFTPHLFLPRLSMHVRSFYTMLTFKHLKKRWGLPDVIYSHYLVNTASAITISKKFNIPIVAMEHWSQLVRTSLPKKAIILANHTYNYPNLKLLTVSEHLQKALESRFCVESEVIPNMLGEDFLSEPLQDKFSKFTFISIGSLIHRKGFDLLIEAASKIKNSSNCEWEILIIGTGKLEERLNQLIKDKNLTNNIKLLGSKTKQQIRAYLSRSHAFVLPSRSETFGVVYIEAMAMGLPVIATDCGIPKNLIDTSTGIVCRPENSDEISEAMIRLINHYNEYNSSEIRRDCLEKYSPQIIAKQIENKLLTSINE